MNPNVEFPLVEAAPPEWIGAHKIESLLPMKEAIDALEQTLQESYDPELDGTRTRMNTPCGQLMNMPSGNNKWCGTKLVTLQPDNEKVGLPVIQGVYILFEGESLTPVSFLDGASLTAIRTPAVTALAIRHLTSRSAGRVVLFGAGVQAFPHIQALSEVFSPDHVDVVGRNPNRIETLVQKIKDSDISASAAQPESVAHADVVLCCTSAETPLFDGSLVRNDAVVAAIGSHDPSSREVDSCLVARSTCVIESLTSAQAEAGDLITPAEEGVFAWDEAITLSDLVNGRAEIPADRPKLFKGTGMPWQDLSIVSEIYLKATESAHAPQIVSAY